MKKEIMILCAALALAFTVAGCNRQADNGGAPGNETGTGSGYNSSTVSNSTSGTISNSTTPTAPK